jgi:hypothetical protein
VLPYPPYSPDLEQSDYHLLSSLTIKEPGHHNAIDEALQNAMHQWLQEECDFCGAGILAVVEGWKKTVDKDGDCIGK